MCKATLRNVSVHKAGGGIFWEHQGVQPTTCTLGSSSLVCYTSPWTPSVFTCKYEGGILVAHVPALWLWLLEHADVTQTVVCAHFVSSLEMKYRNLTNGFRCVHIYIGSVSVTKTVIVYIRGSRNVGPASRGGGVVDRLWGRELIVWGTYLFWMKYGRKVKIYCDKHFAWLK
jgi:hypothetical protein